MPQRHVARSNPERINLYQQITDRIIADLEAGRVPWVQPWGTASAGIGMPHNAVSSRRYSGINVLTLWHAVVSRGFSSHAFLTFRQAAALGGSVRRGERGVGIIYTRRFVPSSERRRRLIWTVCTVPDAPLNGMFLAQRRGSSGRMKRYP
jgi:antirestriction protein ArdC